MENNIKWLIMSMGVTFYGSYLVFNFIMPHAFYSPPPHNMPVLTPTQEKQLTHNYAIKMNSK